VKVVFSVLCLKLFVNTLSFSQKALSNEALESFWKAPVMKHSH
jgi:hypothetical protein